MIRNNNENSMKMSLARLFSLSRDGKGDGDLSRVGTTSRVRSASNSPNRGTSDNEGLTDDIPVVSKSARRHFRAFLKEMSKTNPHAFEVWNGFLNKASGPEEYARATDAFAHVIEGICQNERAGPSFAGLSPIASRSPDEVPRESKSRQD